MTEPELSEPIPYEDLDCEIRHLVRLINDFKGINTVSSCAGHVEGVPVSIAIVAVSQTALYRLMAALPFCGFRGGFLNNYPQTEFICLAVGILEERPLYTLYIGGTPQYAQRVLVGKVENALSLALGYSPRKASFLSQVCAAPQ